MRLPPSFKDYQFIHHLLPNFILYIFELFLSIMNMYYFDHLKYILIIKQIQHSKEMQCVRFHLFPVFFLTLLDSRPFKDRWLRVIFSEFSDSPGTGIGCCGTPGKDNSFGLKHIYIRATVQITRLPLSAPLFGLLCFLIKLFTLAEIYDAVFKWESVVSVSPFVPWLPQPAAVLCELFFQKTVSPFLIRWVVIS